MNWGTKIFLTLAVFIIGMVAVGIYMVSKNSDSLVEEDYYERGINFDEVYQRRQNLLAHQAQPKISVEGNMLHIHFKHQENEGELLLKRASDQSQDIKIPFSVQDDQFQTGLETLSAGAWDLQLIWRSGELDFQYEHKIFIN